MMRKAIVAAFLIGFGIALTLGFQSLTRIGGPRFDPTDVDDLNELRRIAYSLSPAVTSLETIRASEQPLPQSLTAVNGIPEDFIEAFPNLHLSQYEGIYSLYYKLSWDSFLSYAEDNGIWTFDPGDGGPITVLTEPVDRTEPPKP